MLLSSHPPTLSSDRLILRPLKRSDAVDLYEYASDEEVSKHVLWEPHQHISQSRDFIRASIRQYHSGFPGSLAIVEKKSMKMIGTIGFMWIQSDNSAAEVGYSLSRDFWNRGIMTEALKAVIAHGFGSMNLNRIEAQHETTNPASGAVMRKCGMKLEGTLRQRLYNKGR